MRLTKLLILLGILLAITPALAQSTYKLQAGDVIEIWVAQYTDLTRQVTLAPDGWISLPLAGAIKAEGLTLEMLQTALQERLQPFFNDEVGLNISLVPNEQHQPSIFVAGDVDAPGLYAFRPGMTVLHAIAVAGGIYRTPLTTSDRDRSLEVEGLITNTTKRLTELDVMIARLNAQIAGQDTFEVPAGVDATAVAGFVSREQAMLNMQAGNIQAQKDSLERMTAISQDSIAATNEQIESFKERIAVTQERVAATSSLVERGVLQASQLRDLEVNIIDMESSLSQLRSSLAAQEASILTEQSRVNTIMQEFRVGLITQLGTAEREREELQADLANYRATMDLYGPATTPSSTVQYEIVRPVDGGSISVDATEQTVILPGDLIRVSQVTLAAEPALPQSDPAVAPDLVPPPAPANPF